MYLLLLMLDNPDYTDRVMRAWLDLGIRGIYTLEGAGIREPEDVAPTRGPTGFLSFTSLLQTTRYAHGLLLAAVDSLAMAEEAAQAVEQIAGPWGQRRTAMMFALPTALDWGTVPSPVEEAPPEEEQAEAEGGAEGEAPAPGEAEGAS